MIVLPLKTHFPGELEFGEPGDSFNPNCLEMQTKLIYFTLFRGVKSLFGKLSVKNVSVDKYISVYGLRTYDLVNDISTTEQIYVHSKMMIVDDRLTIIGSANINDRSMVGYGDSKVDVIIEDKEMIPGKMNGKPHKVGNFSHSLRCRLLKEHLGMNGLNVDIDVSDPISQHFRENLAKTAARNTHIYEQVFKGEIIPTDAVTNEKHLREWKSKPNSLSEESKRNLTRKIHGHIVAFPQFFLSEYDWSQHSIVHYLGVLNGPPTIREVGKNEPCLAISFIELVYKLTTLTPRNFTYSKV